VDALRHCRADASSHRRSVVTLLHKSQRVLFVTQSSSSHPAVVIIAPSESCRPRRVVRVALSHRPSRAVRVAPDPSSPSLGRIVMIAPSLCCRAVRVAPTRIAVAPSSLSLRCVVVLSHCPSRAVRVAPSEAHCRIDAPSRCSAVVTLSHRSHCQRDKLIVVAQLFSSRSRLRPAVVAS
jgi:hypothetical protein